MGNEKIRAYYDNMAKGITKAQETRNKAPDFTQYDIAYMQEFINPDHALLDLGAGSGLLLNHIKDGFREVVAVELYENFSQFIESSKNTTIINEDLLSFETKKEFDLVILFGVMNFFNAQEAQALYSKFFGFLKPGGKLIVKNQMGIKDDIKVDHFSKELGQNYYSEYRQTDKEAAMMRQAEFEVLRIDDIYPEKFNRWPNTRFIAIVGEKPE